MEWHQPLYEYDEVAGCVKLVGVRHTLYEITGSEMDWGEETGLSFLAAKAVSWLLDRLGGPELASYIMDQVAAWGYSTSNARVRHEIRTFTEYP